MLKLFDQKRSFRGESYWVSTAKNKLRTISNDTLMAFAESYYQINKNLDKYSTVLSNILTIKQLNDSIKRSFTK